MALAFETVIGTAPAGGYTRVPFASTTLGSEQPLITSELLGCGRDPLAPIKDAVTVDGAEGRLQPEAEGLGVVRHYDVADRSCRGPLLRRGAGEPSDRRRPCEL